MKELGEYTLRIFNGYAKKLKAIDTDNGLKDSFGKIMPDDKRGKKMIFEKL
jgi:hypothetical protein